MGHINITALKEKKLSQKIKKMDAWIRLHCMKTVGTFVAPLSRHLKRLKGVLNGKKHKVRLNLKSWVKIFVM